MYRRIEGNGDRVSLRNSGTVDAYQFALTLVTWLPTMLTNVFACCSFLRSSR